ncbi:lipase family protein [Paenibacillus oenotherae]|uniref:Lipase family protein n=1 Tax=Paenibacillus oenotherae TaxID=1435645 RepID=A0ABS7DBH4_9BACL|nr:lipase family protein [Paenibacillus oenotherae]MBW7477288.1 lipase family protein [Paenibacillus oenotherae]
MNNGTNGTFIFWGEFVEIAYDMYNSNARQPVSPANFPAGWQRIANITMDPGILGMKDLEFAGFIAESIDNPLQQAVVFRGTESVLDWLSDFEFIMETFKEVPNAGETEQGFTNLYRSMKVQDVDASKPEVSLINYLDGLPAGKQLTVTGHSLGSAFATLHAFVASTKGFAVDLITFASPRVGDRKFVEAFQKTTIRNTRIYNKPDIVPKVPVELAGYHHVEPSMEIDSTQFPIKHSISCYHALTTYLYVLGDTGADISDCMASK